MKNESSSPIVKYINIDIHTWLDDFGLMDLDLDKCRDFFEVIDSRDSQKSTIIVSQLPVKSWYDLFADNTYADACLDRMVHKAFRLELNGKNMRNPV